MSDIREVPEFHEAISCPGKERFLTVLLALAGIGITLAYIYCSAPAAR